MKQRKQDKLKKAGYRITSTKDLLGLRNMEAELIEVKISLVKKLRETRLFPLPLHLKRRYEG